ncbi:hypothetical protein GTQ99_23205 [Kineococcus sp. T13]|uniref:hypothetical protein n=1 Tax=Kineococcus vitellinus TaxID=2696565 RepID=UPI001413360A|nr:hypothetical protein [Kineococcus vitellinus]NAZ78291.1 hypothetical protein [Kineococcus vitellinus]
MLIDCDDCTVRPHACSECVVSVLLGPPGDAVLDAEERDAVEVLAASGLVPPLRLAPGPAAAAREGRPVRRPARRAAG